jgi:hypothetical protein
VPTGGWGANYSLGVAANITGVTTPPYTSLGGFRNVFSYAGPTVTGVSVITSGSTATSDTTLPLRIAGNLVIDLSASNYNSATYLWDNAVTSGTG